MDKIFTSFSVEDRSFVAFIKRHIHNELLHFDFGRSRIGEIDIVVSELTSNLVKHAKQGELLYRMRKVDEEPVVEIITLDDGPGIADVPRMMKDGVSTSNTLGQGLGAIHRLSSEFQVYSIPKWGTVTYARMGPSPVRSRRSADIDVRAIVVPKPREEVSGDGYAVKKTRDNISVFLGDGLGHGEHACDAVKKACEYFASQDYSDPVQIIRGMHDHVRKTRGLVASVAVLNLSSMTWHICGVGNITTRIYGGVMFKHYMSYNGIVGLNIPNSLSESIIPAEKNQQLIMSSDGLRTRWDLTRYPSILKHDSMLLAAALYKDFNRKNDDSSIFIAKVI